MVFIRIDPIRLQKKLLQPGIYGQLSMLLMTYSFVHLDLLQK